MLPLVLAFLLLLLLGPAGRADAASRVLSRSANPAGGTSGGADQTAGYGLLLTVDTRWLDGFGYRPVRITVTPSAPTVADRTLRLELLLRPMWRGGSTQYELRVQQDIEIPAGTVPAAPIQATLSVPDYGRHFEYALNVFEDGQRRDRLCLDWTQAANRRNVPAESLPRILVLGDSDPDTGELAAPLPAEEYQQYQYQPRRATLPPAPRQQLPTAQPCPLADLPLRWIDYTSLDVVCLSIEQLRQLQQSYPAALQAILHWTAAGGNLWVYDVGEDWQRLEQLEDLVGLPAVSEGVSEGDSPIFAAKTSAAEVASGAPRKSGQSPRDFRGWSEPAKGLFGKPISDVATGPEVEPAADDSGATGVSPVPEGNAGQPPVPPKPPERPPFVLRPLGMGMIAAIAAETPLGEKNAGWKQAQWEWLLNAVGKDRWLWCQRHGLSMVRENGEFWNFLIPGVGLAPVTAFCVLISLFVLAIGPLNYWLLRRIKRLHLLVVTTPLGAAAVTLLLFSYALVSDGLATRVRVRSVTQIDQGRRQAVCWTRLSYYAGLAPWRGLAFPADVAVLPLEEVPLNYAKSWASRELIWDDEQRLAGGWLPSRTSTQFITVRSRPTTLGVELLGSAEASDKLSIKNRLGVPIERLAVRTAGNRCYWGTAIAADATAVLDPIQPDVALRRLQQDGQPHQPGFPPGISRQQYSSGIFGFPRSRYYGPWGGSSRLDAPVQASGRLEKSLEDFANLFAPTDSFLPPAGYVAIVADSPEVVLGAPSARQEASYHVILGRW